MKLVKKMSAATMDAIPKKYKTTMEHGDQVAIFDVMGIAEGVETGSSSMGEWVAFEGTFGATLPNGEKYRSKKLFLPDVASGLLQDAVDSAEGGKVEFAFRVGIRRVVKVNAQGEETGAGYEYTCEPLIEADEADDPLAALSSKLAKVPALTATVSKENEPEQDEELAPKKGGKK